MEDIQLKVKEFLDSETEVHQFAFLPPTEIPFSEQVREACKVNYCGKYGTCWTCPPGAGDWQELRDKYYGYKFAMMFTTMHNIEDSFDFEGMDEAKKIHENTEEALLCRIERWKGSFELLGAGSCKICQSCTYPEAPCIFPDKAKRSMEACGIDVVALSKKFNINYFNGANTVTYFSVLLY